MRRDVIPMLVAISLLAGATSHARADETADVCLADSIEGQVLRNHGRLVRAREHLAQCSRTECEEAIRKRCSEWLDQANAALPRVSIRVVDDRGLPLPEAVVRLDGTPVDVAAPLAVDPGSHAIEATYRGRKATSTLQAVAGSQEVSLTIDLRKTVYERPVPLATYVSGAVALAGFIAFGALGTASLVQVDELTQCSPYCDASRKAPIQTLEISADIALGVGVTALVAGTVFFLARPSVASQVHIGARGLSWAF